MNVALNIVCFAAAALCLVVFFSFGGKSLFDFALRMCFSVVTLALLSLFGVMPFNAIVCAATGTLGAPGLIACAIIARFL